jgi:hypothetical protein
MIAAAAAAEVGDAKGTKGAALQGAAMAVDQWIEDPHGIGAILAGKRGARNFWGIPQGLFLTQEERDRSQLKTKVLESGDETLIDDAERPWAFLQK